MRAWVLSTGLFVASVASAAPSSVALDFGELDAASFTALDGVSLEKSATVRLVQDGFAVVNRSAGPDVVLTLAVRQAPRRLVLVATGSGGRVSSEVPWTPEPLVELHLELVQKLVELSHAAARAAPPRAGVAPPEAPPPGAPAPDAGIPGSATAATPTASPPVPSASDAGPAGSPAASPPGPASPPRGAPAPDAGTLLSPAAPAPTAPPPPGPSPWRLTGSAGVLVRSGGVDPLVTVGVRWGGRFRVLFDVAGSGSHSSALGVIETQASAGAGVALPLWDGAELELAALVGALWHHFALGDPSAGERTGDRLDAVVTVPSTLSVPLGRALRVGLRLAAGWGREREHLAGADPLWARGAARLELGLVLGGWP